MSDGGNLKIKQLSVNTPHARTRIQNFPLISKKYSVQKKSPLGGAGGDR